MSQIVIFRQDGNPVSETFIDNHVRLLPGVAAVVHKKSGVVFCNSRKVPWSKSLFFYVLRNLTSKDRVSPRIAAAYETVLNQHDPSVVLAEYGHIGAELAEMCHRKGIPFVVHFHGYDASRQKLLLQYRRQYRRMFARAQAVIAVSRNMEERLCKLGCVPENIICNPYGVDCDIFCGAQPAISPPTFISVGRFVHKKAPIRTLEAFAKVLENCPSARLRMIGEGHLYHFCQDVANMMKIRRSVDFLGPQPNHIVVKEMQAARAFVQHSVVADDGDAEGTPVAILEAGAAGLPVVATRHEGIRDVVVEGLSGLLVDEHDVSSMAGHMIRLVHEPDTAQAIGQWAASHIRNYYRIEQSLRRLNCVLQAAARREDMVAVKSHIERDLPN